MSQQVRIELRAAQWAQQEGITFDTWDTSAGSVWRGRAEHYLTNPSGRTRPGEVAGQRRLPGPLSLSPAADPGRLRAAAVPSGIAGPGPGTSR